MTLQRLLRGYLYQHFKTFVAPPVRRPRTSRASTARGPLGPSAVASVFCGEHGRNGEWLPTILIGVHTFWLRSAIVKLYFEGMAPRESQGNFNQKVQPRRLLSRTTNRVHIQAVQAMTIRDPTDCMGVTVKEFELAKDSDQTPEASW